MEVLLGILGILGIPLIVLLVLVVLCVILKMSYVKAPPDMAYIISGITKEPRILIGRAALKLPFLERMDYLYLGQMSVDIKTEQSVPTNDFINVDVDAIAKVRIQPDSTGIQTAARNFLNKTSKEIALDLKDSLQGNLREIIGTLSLEAINTNRDAFSDEVMKKASVDMKKLGIEVISCNIQNITDGAGLISDLGMDNTAKIKKNAAIAKANADKDVAVAQAEAAKIANDAKIASETQIAEKNNDLDIRKAELKIISDRKRAEADAAYKIQEQEQQKTIEITTVNAQIAKAERNAELAAKEVTVKEQELEADIKKTADAQKYKIEQDAMADMERRKREAEARTYEEQKQAEAQKALAEAKKYAMEQEASGIKAKGEAEAAAIAAKGLAEAEAMMKKAEAYKQYNNAAIAEMIIQVMPQIASELAKPLANIDKISVIGSDASGMTSIGDGVPVMFAKLFQTMKETTGVDLGEIMRANTFEGKTTKNINISGNVNMPKQNTTIQQYENTNNANEQVKTAIESAVVTEAVNDN